MFSLYWEDTRLERFQIQTFLIESNIFRNKFFTVILNAHALQYILNAY